PAAPVVGEEEEDVVPLASTLAMAVAVGDLGDRAADRGPLLAAGEQQFWGPPPPPLLPLPVPAVFCLLPLPPPPLQLLLLPPPLLLLPAGEVREDRRRREGLADVWLVLPPPPWLASSMPTSTSRDCWDSSPPVKLLPEFPRVVWAPRTLLPP
ncbi:unnamed protein product, partial [Ectocarpus sp. 8 AP-2014]